MEKEKPTKYESGKEFYRDKIASANQNIEQSQTPFERITAQEDMEIAALKILHLERREQEL